MRDLLRELPKLRKAVRTYEEQFPQVRYLGDLIIAAIKNLQLGNYAAAAEFLNLQKAYLRGCQYGQIALAEHLDNKASRNAVKKFFSDYDRLFEKLNEQIAILSGKS